MNIPSYFVMGLSVLLLATTSASAQTKQEVVKAWQQHVTSLNSLRLDYEVAIKRTDDLVEPFRANEPLTWKYKFVLSGDKYFSYVELPGKVKEISAMAAAYNGDYYQALTDSEGKVRVNRWTKEKDFEFPYLGGHPLTAQYKFAFELKAPISIRTLKNPATWERLVKRIAEVRPLSRSGRQGLIVKVEIPRSRRIYEVFVDDKTLLPHQWSIVGLAGAGEVEEEMEVKTFTSVGKQGSSFMFPSEVIVARIRNERLLDETHYKANLESLKVNEPIPQGVFTISAPRNAILVDEDVEERIFREEQRSAASRDAAKLPRAEDNPNNRIGLAQPIAKAGDMAPNFSLADSSGKTWSLTQLRGQKGLLLTFFPKCFTGGCANHLSSLRDVYPQLQAADIEVLAVSVDPAEGEKGQKEFARQWKLPFSLIPDTERTLSLLYGAAQSKEQLAARMTVLIDKQGIVRYVDTNVNVENHGADMLAEIRELGLH